MNLIILRFIHYCIALSTFVKQWIFRLSSLSFSKKNISAIQADARNLKKLPLHLGMLFLEDDISYSDIANAILWSVAMGISFISIFDANGVVKRNEKTLYEEIKKRKGTDLDTEQCKADIQLHSSLQKRPDRSSSQVDVFLLSSGEGRKSIVEVAKNICQLVIEKQIKSSEITPQFIDFYFQGETGYPDPDLVIKFGLTESLMGFMPWHVRLTEILSYPSHVGLDYKTFRSLVVSYGNTHQRYGK